MVFARGVKTNTKKGRWLYGAINWDLVDPNVRLQQMRMDINKMKEELEIFEMRLNKTYKNNTEIEILTN